MAIPKIKKLYLELSTNRIETLTDGIFAIAMTLLVLNLNVSLPGEDASSATLHKALLAIWPHLLHYVQSFLILAIFWIKHHQQFHFVKRSDRNLLHLNILCLLFICLIPFSTSLAGNYGDMLSAALFFELNMFAAGMAYFLHWCYVTKNHRLVDKDLDPEVIRSIKYTNMVLPLFSVAAIGVSILSPRAGGYLYFLIPPVLWIVRRR